MEKGFKKDLGDLMLEFCIQGESSGDSSWTETDIRVHSRVFSYDLKDWERDGEIFTYKDMRAILELMRQWSEGTLKKKKVFRASEPVVALTFHLPQVFIDENVTTGESERFEIKRIDLSIFLQTNNHVFTDNHIVLPLYNKDAEDFVKYWKAVAYEKNIF